MSKNTDFFKLGPYSRKNSIRTGTETKIGQTESNRAKLAVTRALGMRGHACGKAPVAGCTRTYFRVLAGRPVRFSPVGSARVAVRLGLQATRGDASLELRCSSGWSTRVRRLSPSSAARQPTLFFFLSSLPSKNRNTVLFSDFPIFRFVYLIDMIPSTKF